ncbi:hypothetical protein SAMN02745166_03584 [Prosthecobacter debontii]|uniref:LTXXQ motif family protein n=2 Tax=Prosthecobacter debontii TaxID=48467 RepID=A0A1T4YKJ3_9BACT|nr:hypothetical protein SAMN02745166_03584 [Prosthecobacter debontii]
METELRELGFRGCTPSDPMKTTRMKSLLALPALLTLLTATALHAEPPAAPPKGDREGMPPPPPHFGPPKGGERDSKRDWDRGGDRGDRRGGGGSGMPGFGGRPPMRHDAFDKLPEEDKKRVREALDKVWSRPEVIAAKDKAMRANEEMRDTIRESLTKIDPEAAAILERIEPKDHFDPRELPRLPATDSPDFPKVMVRRMGMELQSFSRPERRDETRKLHERVMTFPQVQEALAKLESSTGEERVQATQKLREVYREAIFKEFQNARERRAADGNKDGGPGPGSPDVKPRPEPQRDEQPQR